MRYRSIALASSALAMLACNDTPTVPRAQDATPTAAVMSVDANTTVVPAGTVAATNECGSFKTGWIFCDDFEQDRTAKYFEYDKAGGKFVRNAGSGVNGSTAMRATYTKGQAGAGSLHLAFGRTPSSYFRPADAGTANYRELYWRVWVRKEPGWTADGPWKLTRATIIAKSDWSQAAIAHGWSDENNLKYMLLDPASGTNASGSVITSGYNDMANLKWIGATRTDSTYDDNKHAGLWECDEFHARLNDAGQSNALFEMTVNGHLAARKAGFNWVGSYNAYGFNALFLEQYWNNGAPAANVRDIDNFVVSTQPIGCGGSTGGTVPPVLPPAGVATVTVTPASASLVVGKTMQLSATDADASGTVLNGQTNAWTSSNGAVATVSAAGLVTAVAPGTATIKATNGTVSGAATLTVSATPAPTVAVVSVSPATSTLVVGQTAQLSATDLDASGKVLTGQTNVWASSNSAIATVSAAGLVTAVASGTTTIKATNGAVSGTATVTVSAPTTPPPPPSSGDYAHQPSGFSLFTERAFNSKASSKTDNTGAEGWNAGDEAQWPNFSIAQDPTAPKSPGSVGQMKYPAGFSGGYAPGYADKNFPSGNSRVYMSIWVKLSSNFYGHSSYVNKMLFMWMAGQPKFILSADGPGTGALVPTIRIQDSPDSKDRRLPNVVTSAQVVRGQWQHWEVLATANTPGQANGQVQWWIDGQLVSDYRDINLAGSGESTSWEIFQWGPTWGGVGSTVPADQYVWWDHVYVSVAK